MARAILIVLDGLGVGHAPDAAEYGDAGSNTLANMAQEVGGLNIPILQNLGLGNIQDLLGVPAVPTPGAGYGRLQEVSAGKDSTTGHWELMGLVTEKAFPTYPNGFPEDVLAEFTRLTGYGVLGNKAASGTAIIEELGDEHIASGNIIVYTSADSVFQVAAHDEVCDLEELYRVCEVARKMLDGQHRVSRVIARPFTGPSGQYSRTEFRHDYSVEPPEGSLVLTALQKHGVRVLSIGKIYDLFAGTGIDESHVSRNNAEGMAALDKHYGEADQGDTLILLNLVDFDMLWGHRNDPQGMKKGLEIFDVWLGGFLPTMAAGDLLLMTADHGNDPTTTSTDHSREQVPILAYLAGEKSGIDLGVREGFMDVAATYAEFFDVPALRKGTGFLSSLKTEDEV